MNADVPIDHFSILYTPIRELPNEILVYTLAYLPGDEIMKCERVCKEWQDMIHHVDESRERFIEIRGGRRRRGKANQERSTPNQFWVNICDLHFRDAMVLRRKYPSKIQPVTFYIHNKKMELLRDMYSLEKSITSLEQALESESSLFSDVCIFSVDLMEIFTKLHKLDKFYNGQYLDNSDFDKHELEFATDFYPLLNEYRRSRDSNKLIRFVALIKLNEQNLGKRLTKLMNAQSEKDPWSPVTRQRRHDENIRVIERELLLEKLDVETLEDFGRNDHNQGVTYDPHTLSQLLQSSNSLDHKLTELYREWTKRWYKVLRSKEQYAQFYKHIDLEEIESVLITQGFTFKNGKRYANGSLQRKAIYSFFLQHKIL